MHADTPGDAPRSTRPAALHHRPGRGAVDIEVLLRRVSVILVKGVEILTANLLPCDYPAVGKVAGRRDAAEEGNEGHSEG